MGSPQSTSLPWGFLPSDLGASMAGDGASASETANHLGQILSQEGRAGLGWAGLGWGQRVVYNLTSPRGCHSPGPRRIGGFQMLFTTLSYPHKSFLSYVHSSFCFQIRKLYRGKISCPRSQLWWQDQDLNPIVDQGALESSSSGDCATGDPGRFLQPSLDKGSALSLAHLCLANL